MTGIDASTYVGVATAAVACALYVATYRSFLYLLRYPRNWTSPSLPECLATGALAVFVVALVSLSVDGLDIPSLVVTSVFITALFTIIAAPAYAFQPASGPVEFLAKHGDYAGLWLLGPALIAGLAIPNIKLQAVLVTAMAVEAMWFTRQRLFGKEGRVYPLNDRDLSVLKTQAKDDLKAFQRRHNIRELVLSNGAVNWRGCERTKAACPFNLYVNRLGLNTAPCCREHMKDLSHYIAGCLSRMGAVHWLEGGSLLGAIECSRHIDHHSTSPVRANRSSDIAGCSNCCLRISPAAEKLTPVLSIKICGPLLNKQFQTARNVNFHIVKLYLLCGITCGLHRAVLEQQG